MWTPSTFLLSLTSFPVHCIASGMGTSIHLKSACITGALEEGTWRATKVALQILSLNMEKRVPSG